MQGYSNIIQRTAFPFQEPFESQVQKILQLKKNQVLLLGEYAQYSFYVKKGSVKVMVGNETGFEKLLFYVDESGFILMNVAHYLPEHFFATLVADAPTTLYCLPATGFHQAMEIPEMRDLFFDSSVRKMQYMIKHVFEMTYGTSRSQLYNILLDFAQDYGVKNEQGHIIVHKLPNRGDISAMTGIHRTNIATYLTELESQDIIARQGRKIIVKDIVRLQQLVINELRQR